MRTEERKQTLVLNQSLNSERCGVSDFQYLQIHHDLSDAAQNGDEIKNVPRVPKVILNGTQTKEF